MKSKSRNSRNSNILKEHAVRVRAISNPNGVERTATLNGVKGIYNQESSDIDRFLKFADLLIEKSKS